MQVTYTRGDQPTRHHRLIERIGEYKIGRAIGKGNFAVVRLAKHSLSNTEVSIKIVNKNHLDEDSVKKIDREIRILKTLVHPHIIKLYEIIRTEQFIYIVTEYAGNGEVFEMLTEKGRVDEREARRLFQQTSAAIAYCHSRGIVHRDLKAENLLLDSQNNVKLIDFGFSNFQQPQSLLSTWCGSPPYAAPELLLGKEYDGMKADVWSLGVVLYILVAGGFPFPSHSLDKLKCAVLAGQLKIPYWVSVECSDLIRKMLTFHPSKRYSIENVVQHRWFVAEQSSKMQQLIAESLSRGVQQNETLPSLQSRLNPTVMLFMQQHTKFSEEQIIEDVKNKNYESPLYGTYELLCEKLRDEVDEVCSQPRRGSRGSIVSGKANVDITQQHSTPTISAHHLAKLSLSTNNNNDDDSERSDTSDVDDAQSPACSWAKRHAVQLSTVMGAQQSPAYGGNRAEMRRHTLCAADQTIPLETLLLAQQIPTDASLAANNYAAAAAALATHHTAAANPFANTTIPTNLLALNHLPLYTYNRILPLPSLERRASAGEALFGVSGYEQLMSGTQQQQQQQQQQATAATTLNDLQAAAAAAAAAVAAATAAAAAVSQGAQSSSQTPHHRGSPLASVLTVEEEGERYLSKCGEIKRNTVHCISGTSDGPMSLSRFVRSPYSKQNGSERRSSWTSPSQHASLVTPQQQAQLERIYKQTIAGGSDQLNAIQQLQREFKQLRASTQASPITTRATSSLLDSSSSSLQCAPLISITDEHNRCLTQPSSSAVFDPVSMFEKQADNIVFGQRPATAIGFSSMPDSISSEQQQQQQQRLLSPQSETTAESIVSSLEMHQVLCQLRNALDSLHITYEETPSTLNESHRICVDNGDTGRVEIGITSVPLSISQMKSKVDFVCSGIDMMSCGQLCKQLINQLNLPT